MKIIPETIKKWMILKRGYDLSPLSVDYLLVHQGFKVVISHGEYMLKNCPTELKHLLVEEMDKLQKHFPELSNYKIAEIYNRNQAVFAELARGRINYGIQVSKRIGTLVDTVVGIRVIGAESKLTPRGPERGVNDLDLIIDLCSNPTAEDLKLIQIVQDDAKEKTGVPINIICPGLLRTPANSEHLGALFDYPLSCRGFPVFWRKEDYHDQLLKRKNQYFEQEIADREIFRRFI